MKRAPANIHGRPPTYAGLDFSEARTEIPSSPAKKVPAARVQKGRVERGIGTEILGSRIDAEVGTGGKGVVCLDEQASRASDEDV
jgi:hypothetical protein